ncbi:MAG: hypothetical protein OXB88_08350 [Bacteriovoracales bacterium]|nr:hypothetical protein [Bacteriovoracales bacterium]
MQIAAMKLALPGALPSTLDDLTWPKVIFVEPLSGRIEGFKPQEGIKGHPYKHRFLSVDFEISGFILDQLVSKGNSPSIVKPPL